MMINSETRKAISDDYIVASDNFGENDDEDPDHKGQVFISPIHETARETLVPCVKMTLLMMRAMDTTVILHVSTLVTRP